MGRECSTEARVSRIPNRATCTGQQQQLEIRGNIMDVSDDVVFYVGHSRKAYNVSAESLIRSSAYFRNLLSKRRAHCAAGPILSPVVMDCEESVFEGLLLLLRYGAWEALSPLSQAQAFRLKKEAELYGVHYTEPPKPPDSPASSPGGSPKSNSTESARPPPPCRRLSGRLCDGTRLAGSTSRQLAELPDFPLDLADPTKLLLVACMDEDKGLIYACEHCSGTAAAAGVPSPATQWALSFYYRHAFCTACGRPPTKMPPKFFAEMFTGAAATYSQSTTHELLQPAITCKAAANWWLGSDSTCLLRLVSSCGSGPDACSSAMCTAAAGRSSGPHQNTVWAATFFYSYAFCTRCGQAANGSALLSLLLALRYGGTSSKGSSKGARSSFKIPSLASPEGL